MGENRADLRINLFLTPFTKINLKWIRDLNVRVRTKRVFLRRVSFFSEKNIGVNVHDLGLGKAFLDMTPKVQVSKET